MENLTLYLFLQLLLSLNQTCVAQNCLTPTISNGNLFGDLTEGGTAAVLCATGYLGGGAATCAGGAWTVLPTCTARDCGQPTVANGILLGDTFYEGSAIVNCDVGHEGGGMATCGSGGTWTTLPGCTAVDCLTPTISNGNFVGDLTEGGTAAVLCATGYLGGGAATCAGGAWTVLPTCTARDCGQPTVANGILLGDTFYEGSAIVNCDVGHEGGGTATCGSGGTWTTLPGCTAVDCGDPNIAHSTVIGNTLYNGGAFIQCYAGYSGGGTATCTTAGVWDSTTLPSCSPKDCGTPTITNGALSGSTLYAGSATVNCNTGYEGDGTATCQADGTWAALPACTLVDCSTPTISNGGLQAGSDTFFGGTATAQCNAGYEGGGVITCQSSGSWTANPDPCTPVDCGTPTVTNGNFFGDTHFTGTANVVCSNGYDGTGTATCNTDKTWSKPTCTAKYCGTLTVANGVFTGDTFYGGSALVTCNTGYDGSGTATCGTSGTWTNPPTCNAKDCGDPNIAHSTVIGNTLYNGGAFILCDAGYSGGGTATCTTAGVWDSTTLPSCSPKDCGEPTIPNGFLTGSTLYDGTATVDCDSGYEGGGTATCQNNAQWETLPTCEPEDCSTPTIANGALGGGSSTRYAGSAFVVCDSGYELAGSAVATCLASGNWDTLPVCDPKDCGSLANPVHGSVSAPITTYQSVATYTCESLYQLNGSSTLTCEADGNWASDPPTCDDIDCPDLTAPTNGAISTTVVKVGTTVIVSCDATYTLFGDKVFQCETGGIWNVSTMGTCRLACGTPNVANGALSGDDFYTGTATIVCNAGYTGGGSATCLRTAVWDTLPTCDLRDCGTPTIVNGALSATSSTLYDGLATVECDAGYTGGGAVTCLDTGNWGTIPACNARDFQASCSDNNGVIVGLAVIVGITVLLLATSVTANVILLKKILRGLPLQEAGKMSTNPAPAGECTDTNTYDDLSRLGPEERTYSSLTHEYETNF